MIEVTDVERLSKRLPLAPEGQSPTDRRSQRREDRADKMAKACREKSCTDAVVGIMSMIASQGCDAGLIRWAGVV